jgi:hypothetical protein
MNSIARPFPDAFLERIYPLPKPMRSIEEWQREHHQDLEALDDFTLQRERRCVQHRLDYETDQFVRSWLAVRLTAIDRERGSRRTTTSPDRPPRPPAAASRPVKDAPGGFEYRRGRVVGR